MLVITTDSKIPIKALNHNGLCTTCFNICKTSILPTGLIYEFHMILRTKFDYYFLQKMFLKMAALNTLQCVYHQKSVKFEIGGKIITFLILFFRNVIYFPLPEAFEITNHIVCVRACVC
jgi:hypothetical protein